MFFDALTTIALTFFEPMTAPRPLRAASRPRSLQMPAISDIFSPAGPMQATLAFLPCRSLQRHLDVDGLHAPEIGRVLDLDLVVVDVDVDRLG